MMRCAVALTGLLVMVSACGGSAPEADDDRNVQVGDTLILDDGELRPATSVEVEEMLQRNALFDFGTGLGGEDPATYAAGWCDVTDEEAEIVVARYADLPEGEGLSSDAYIELAPKLDDSFTEGYRIGDETVRLESLFESRAGGDARCISGMLIEPVDFAQYLAPDRVVINAGEYADLEAFCLEFERTLEDVDAREELISDATIQTLERMKLAASDPRAADIGNLIEYYTSGALDPDDPLSFKRENFVLEIRSAIDRILADGNRVCRTN